MAASIEVLLDMCLGSCLKPGVINADLNALKRFLYDLSHGVQDLQKMKGQRMNDDLMLKLHKMACDLERVQLQLDEVQKDSDAIEDLTRDVETIKMDLTHLAECSRLMNSTLQKLHDQLVDSPSTKMETEDYLSHLQIAVQELVKRVEHMEHRKNQGRSQSVTQALLQAESKTVQGKGKKQKKKKHLQGSRDEEQSEEKLEMSECDRDASTELMASTSSVQEGKVAFATAFRDFMTMLNQTQFVKASAVEDFLTMIKGSDEITSEMIKELMTVFSKSQGVPSSLVPSLIAMMEKKGGLTIGAMVTLLDMVQTLPFMHRALRTLLEVTEDLSSLPATALLEILEILRSATFVDVIPLINMLEHLSSQEGFINLLYAVSNRPVFSVDNLLPLIDACKGVSRSSLMEIITVMENMDPEDLKERVSTLFSIPGYFLELMSSLPVVPSIEVQSLALEITSLSGEVSQMIQEFIDATTNSWTSRSAIMQALKDVVNIVMDDPNLHDNWLVKLLDLLKTTSHVRAEHVAKFLSLLKGGKNCLESDAIHVFIDTFRRNELTPRAVVDFVTVLNECGVTPAVLTRLLRLLGQSTIITPASIRELLSFMKQTGLLSQDFFLELREVANSSQLAVPSNITTLLKLLKDVKFMTLDNIGSVMHNLSYVSKDELDGHLRQMSHVHSQQMQILVTSCILKEPEEYVLSRLASVNELSPPSSSIGDFEQQRFPLEALRILESEVAEVQKKQTAILDLVTPKGQPVDPCSPRRYRSDVTLPNIFPPDPSRYPVIRIVADKSVETDGEISDSGLAQTATLNLLLEEKKCHENQIQLLDDAIKQLQKEKANLTDLKQVKDTHHQQTDLMRRFTKLSTVNETHEEKIKCLLQRQVSQETSFVSEQEKVRQELKNMVTKTDLRELRHGLKEEVISAVYQEILRDSAVACTKRPLKTNCLSCDRKLICLPESPYPQVPAPPGFPPARPERPHTVFELNMVRRHARSLLMPHNMLTVDFYAVPRQAGGIQTEYVRKEWSSRCFVTYPAQTPDSFIRGADGRVYAGASQPVFLPQVTTTTMTSLGHYSTQNMAPRVLHQRVSRHRPFGRPTGNKK